MEVVEGFADKIEKIYKVLYTIELYLGVNEDVVQLIKGNNAPSESSICFRQQILYMDEEIGVYENGGLGYEDIPKFDEWISDNFKKILHEEKGVVVFRVRRNKKSYTGNSFIDGEKHTEDSKTYFLIRNGDNLYRIHANIRVYPRLFPLKHEINSVLENIKWKRDEKDADKLIMSYQRNFLVLQGILDRTDIFSPIPEGVNVFDIDKHKDVIKRPYALGLRTGRFEIETDELEKVVEYVKTNSKLLV